MQIYIPGNPIYLLLAVDWLEILQHGVMVGIEGFQVRTLGFGGSNQDSVCKTDAM